MRPGRGTRTGRDRPSTWRHLAPPVSGGCTPIVGSLVRHAVPDAWNCRPRPTRPTARPRRWRPSATRGGRPVSRRPARCGRPRRRPGSPRRSACARSSARSIGPSGNACRPRWMGRVRCGGRGIAHASRRPDSFLPSISRARLSPAARRARPRALGWLALELGPLVRRLAPRGRRVFFGHVDGSSRSGRCQEIEVRSGPLLEKNRLPFLGAPQTIAITLAWRTGVGCAPGSVGRSPGRKVLPRGQDETRSPGWRGYMTSMTVSDDEHTNH
jgi:hypothetical protein